MRTNDKINFEAPSNVDNGTGDGRIQSSVSNIYQSQFQEYEGEQFGVDEGPSRESTDNSTYEPLDVIQHVVRFQKLDLYENLNKENTNEKRETLPLHTEQIAVSQSQPVSYTFPEKSSTQNQDPLGTECNETTQTITLDNNETEKDVKSISSSSINGTTTEPDAGADPPSLHDPLTLLDPSPLHIYLDLVNEEPSHEPTDNSAGGFQNSYQVISKDVGAISKDNNYEKEQLLQPPPVSTNLKEIISPVEEDYDYINEYDKIPIGGHGSFMDEGMQCGVHGQTGRPLPVIPIDTYERLNLSTFNSSTRVPRISILNAKIILILTLIIFGVAAVVTTTVVLTNPNYGTVGKRLVHIDLINILHRLILRPI